MSDAPSRDRVRGALLGLALGDAMGMPVDGLSHQNVRTYYKGIKGLTADEKRRDLGPGQWTAHTQRASALARMLAAEAPGLDRDPGQVLDFDAHRDLEDALVVQLAFAGALRRYVPHVHVRRQPDPPFAAAAAMAAPFGAWAAARAADAEALAVLVHEVLWPREHHPTALAAAVGLAGAVAHALTHDPATGGGEHLLRAAVDAAETGEDVAEAPDHVSKKLRELALYLDDTPLDLQDRCDGTGDRAYEAFPFAVAMAARGPDLVEATLLSAVNVGGAASAVGAMVGALLGAFNGWSAFPDEWRDGLEDADRLLAEADALADALGLEI